MPKIKLNKYASKEGWVLPKEESCIAPGEVWSNKGEYVLDGSWWWWQSGTTQLSGRSLITSADMDPSPPEYRTWTSWTFFTYWVADLINP
jgi:NCS1 family nucleobase:cation symporter-1